MSRTLLRRTPPSPPSRLLLLRLVKSQPAFLAAGTGVLFKLTRYDTLLSRRSNTQLYAPARLLASHYLLVFHFFSIFFFFFRLHLHFSCLEYGSDGFLSVMVYGLRCSILPLDLRRRGYFRFFFFFMSFRFLSRYPVSFERQFSFVYLLVTVMAHAYRDNEFRTTKPLFPYHQSIPT